MNHRILSCLLIMLAGMSLAMRAWALDPLNQPFPETRAKPTMALTRSSVADQLILEPLPHNLEDERGFFWIDSQLAYREHGTGRVVLTRSGQEKGRILNPERPYYRLEEYPFDYAIGCLTSREGLDGGSQWVRAVTHVGPGSSNYSWDCQVLVEGDRSSWIRTPDAIHRLGLDGQDLVAVPVAALELDVALAANVDPRTDDLILVYRKQVTSQLAMLRITTRGQWVPIELPSQIGDVIHPEILVDLFGPWSLLTKRADGSQWLTQWSEDFSQHVSNPLRVPILRAGTQDQVLDLRRLGSGQALVLVRTVSNNYEQRSFTLFKFSGVNDIEQVAQGEPQEDPERLFPITPTNQGIALTVLKTSRRGVNFSSTLTLRTFLGTQLAEQGAIELVNGHQFTAIGESGEFLVAERQTDPIILNVTLLDHAARVLERGVISAQPQPESWFLGALPDGHMRVAVLSIDSEFTVLLSRHDRDGRMLWRTPWPTFGADHMTADDTRVCAAERFGAVSCFRMSDGLFLGTDPETFEPDCRVLHGIPRLVDGLLFRGQCLLTRVAAPPSQLARVVMLAPAHLRYPNGDVLWSNGVGVRKLSAQGQLLSGFDDDGGNWDALTLRGSRGRPVPLRILEDGGYVFAREETSEGVSGVAIRRIRANGDVAWRHFEPLASFEFPAVNVHSALDTESMEVFTDRVMLQIYLNLPPVRPRQAPPPFDTQPGRPIELLLEVGDGGLIRRDGMDVEWIWHRKIPHRGGILEVQNDRVRMLDLDGNEQFQFRHKARTEWATLSSFPVSLQVAVNDRLLRLQDHLYSLPDVFPRYRLDQETLDGPWAVQVLGVDVSDNTLNGQGLVFDYLPRDRLLFGAWFLYAPDAYWRESDLRWLTLSGVIPENAARATLGIYETAAGQFDQGVAGAPRLVGQATLELDSCHTGTLHVTITEGLYEGVGDEYVVRQVAPWQTRCSTTSEPAATVPARSGFGFSTRQSGGYYEPGKDGQGLTLQVRPDIGPRGTFFATWFTFDPAGASNDPDAHHWLTLQGDLASAVDGRIRARIVRTNGGEPLEKEYSRDFFNYRPAPAFDVVVGEAWVSLTGCDRAEVQYRFDETELAGSFAGREGSTQLIGYGVCEP